MKSIRIPEDRVGALIGKGGAAKKMLENRSGIQLNISKDGEVTYDDEKEGVDALNCLKIMDVIKAVGRGFTPEKAMKIFDDDDVYVEMIDIKDAIGDRQAQVQRARGRLIGSQGKTRKLIEDLADVDMCVYGNTVTLMGNSISLPIAKQACVMLLHGSEHSTVYHYLESQRPRLRIAEMGFDL